MTIDEKIASYTEKVESKKQKLAEVVATIDKKKAVAKSLSNDIESLTKSIFDMEAQRLFCMLKDKGIGIGTVIEAVTTGIFDKEECAINSTNENGADNSAEEIKQEEITDEISGSGKALGNA